MSRYAMSSALAREKAKVHTRQLQYLVDVAPRKMIAADLAAARRTLRDRVDELDLKAMEAA